MTSQSFGIYAESASTRSADTLVGSAAGQTTSGSTTTTTFYDAFGNAVANVATATTGQSAPPVSYKVYDLSNRLVYEIDAKGFVTGYQRDVFGGGVRVTRYSQGTALNLGVPTSAATAPSAATITTAVSAPSATNRQIDYAYDALGRIVQTSGPVGTYNNASSATTDMLESNVRHVVITQYDAFGEVVLTRDLQNATQGVYAETYNYFDAGGRNTTTVDARGFATQRTFDAFDNLAQSVEFAAPKTDTWTTASYGSDPGPVPALGANRTANYTYDRLNRKSTETHSLAFESASDISNGSYANTGAQTSTSYGYDSLGNLVLTSNESGSTYMEYDALGRLRATIQPVRRNALDGSVSTPLTEFWYDEFGQRTVQVQRALSAANVADFRGVWTDVASRLGYAISSSTLDRTTMTVYDKAGHATEVDGAMASTGNTEYRTYNAYDAMGRLAKTWHTVSGKTAYVAYEYDAVGQLAVSYAPSSGSASQHAVDTEYTFNGFGEMTAKGVKGTTYETCDYDNNGNLWRSNAGDGVVRVYMYDLSGRQTSVVLSDGASTSDRYLGAYAATAWGQAYTDISGGDPIYRRTDTVYDKMGNAVATILPQRENANGGFSLISGAIGVSSSTTSVNGKYQANVTATWPNLSALGSGDIRIVAIAQAGHVPYTATAYFSGAGAVTSGVVAVVTGTSVPDTPPTVEISKKDTNGDWQVVALNGPNGTSFNVVAIAAPTGATGVQFTYQSSSMGSPVTATPTNFGGVWGMALTGISGVVTYTVTSTYPGVPPLTTSTSPATFTIGNSSNVVASPSFLRPVTLQGYDRWGNLLSRSDPRSASWLTKYSYNSNNQVIRQVQGVMASDASVWSGFDNSGAQVTAAPTTNIYYDAQGRQVEVVDANGHKTVQKFDAGGNLIETDQGFGTADLSKAASLFNAFGDKVQSISGRGFGVNGVLLSNASDFTTIYGYDSADNLKSTTHGTTAGGTVYVWSTTGTGNMFYPASSSSMTNLSQSSTYDAEGHKLTDVDGAGAVTTYVYDINGNLTSTTLPLLAGQVTANAAKTTQDYDDFGHKTKQTDANGVTETWSYDYFGKRLSSHSDMAANLYAYTYDNAGELLTQTSKTPGNAGLQAETYTYDKAGQLLRLSQAVDAIHVRVTAYTYDLSGNRLRETTSQGTSSVMAVFQDNHLAYDTLGRLMDSSDGSVHVNFGYDAVGNRIHTATHVILDQALSATGTASPPSNTDSWNSFDALNRQIHVSYAANLTTNASSHTLAYDADSNRIADSHLGNTVVLDYVKKLADGEPVNDVYKVGQSSVTVTDNYAFDALDRLVNTWRLGASGDQQVIDMRKYDADGRTVMQGPGSVMSEADGLQDYQGSYYRALNKNITDPSLQIGLKYTLSAYDTHGQVIYSRSQSTLDPTTALQYSVTDFSTQMTNGVQTRGYDAAGNLMGSLTTNYSWTNSVASTQTVVNTLSSLESYHVATTNTTVGSISDTATTTYDRDGFISLFTDPAQPTFSRGYVSDASGQVLSTTEGTQVLRNLVVAGHVLGQYGTGLDPGKPQNTNQTANLTERANFGFGFKQISGAAAGSGSYVVNAGDTLQSIAYSVYGDSGQWWQIAQANGLGSDRDLRVGETLRIPSVTGGTHNASGTFDPYDPSKIVGDVNPHLGGPPAGRCAATSAFIGVVVAAVVTVVAEKFGLGAWAPVIGAAAGDGARQYTYAAFNHRLDYSDFFAGGLTHPSEPPGFTGDTKYDYTSTAIAVAAAYAGGQASSALSPSVGNAAALTTAERIGVAAASAAASDVTSQGLRIAIGEQQSFNWRELAGSAAGAGIGEGVTAGIGADLKTSELNAVSQKIISGTVGGFAGGVTAAVTRGGKWSVAAVAADAFGNAIGSSFTESSTGVSSAMPVGDRLGDFIDQNQGAWDARTAESDRESNRFSMEAALDVTAANAADPMPEGSIDSILRRQGVGDGSTPPSRKVYLNPTKAAGTLLDAATADLHYVGRDGHGTPTLDAATADVRATARGALPAGSPASQAPRNIDDFASQFATQLAMSTAKSSIEYVLSRDDVSKSAREILNDFMRGSGDAVRTYGSDSSEVKELFSGYTGRYFNKEMEGAIDFMAKKYDGAIPNGGTLTNYKYSNFGPIDGAYGLLDGVQIGDVVGTFTSGISVVAKDGQLYFQATNKMSLESFSGNNILRHDLVKNPTAGPFSTKVQVFNWIVPNPLPYKGVK